jgi:hypothetical protein
MVGVEPARETRRCAMSERSETERQQVLDRLRRKRPDDTWFICGYPGNGPPGYQRVYSTNRLRYADVPEDGVLGTHPIPGDGREPGIALIVKRDADWRVKRTTLSELLDGSILEKLADIAEVLTCWTFVSRTPKHVVGAWLDTRQPDVDWRPWPHETDDAGAPPGG